MREKIERVINETFADIREIYKLQKTREGNPTSSLRFPYKYRHRTQGELRISEQELRCLFVEKLQNKGLYYNIEAPTIDDYRFENAEGGKRSGNFDLVICDATGKERYALIEFKGLNPDEKCYAKDYWKLQNPQEQQEQEVLRYFLQVVKSAKQDTYQNIANKKASIKKFAKDGIFKVDPCDLTESVIYRCVCLEGDAEISEEINKTVPNKQHSNDPNHP